MTDEKPIGARFCDALYKTLAYSCKKILEEDFSFKEECYMYSELFEHFEYVMLQIKPIAELMEMYDDINPELVGFAITQDVDDFDIQFSLNNETLKKLRDKIDKQIEYNIKEYGDTS